MRQPNALEGHAPSLEQFSELRDARCRSAHPSILRPAQCFALAPLAKKTLRLFVKCSSAPVFWWSGKGRINTLVRCVFHV
ncbi:hypothetical protein DVJ83_11955 [Deinococcus wulumuqiensis]|uniref:Uncharacterized protein n=1 Tax=Deinococcus wulumuqiensis TaxID=980427 RepID=A0A345IKF2_9DEIO|nr:hypothetical protein DVJ83_11955 [Deinococcus wulumuqiensis]